MFQDRHGDSTDSAPGTPRSDRTYRPSSSSARSDAGTILPSSYGKTAHQDDGDTFAQSSEDGSYTSSINSSIMAYRTINGRRYHAERGNAAYWGANDDQQLESMDLYAHLLQLSIGGALHKAPLDRDTLKKAVDIGTGTGVWAIDFADEYPDCEVIGTDISPIQPSWVPSNLIFEIEDCTQEWTFSTGTFDYVHMRLLYGSVADWDALFDEAYRVCRPGGWIESHEASPDLECDDGSVPSTSAIAQWGDFFFQGGTKLGRTFEVIQKDIQVQNMKRLRLQDIQVVDIKTPMGDWPKDPVSNEIGRAGRATLEKDYEGYVSFMARLVRDWDEGDVSNYCDRLRRDIRDTKHHCYFRQRVVWGRKPLDAPDHASQNKDPPEEPRANRVPEADLSKENPPSKPSGEEPPDEELPAGKPSSSS